MVHRHDKEIIVRHSGTVGRHRQAGGAVATADLDGPAGTVPAGSSGGGYGY